MLQTRETNGVQGDQNGPCTSAVGALSGLLGDGRPSRGPSLPPPQGLACGWATRLLRELGAALTQNAQAGQGVASVQGRLQSLETSGVAALAGHCTPNASSHWTQTGLQDGVEAGATLPGFSCCSGAS